MCHPRPKYRFIAITYDSTRGWKIEFVVETDIRSDLLTERVIKWIMMCDDQCPCGTYDYWITANGLPVGIWDISEENDDINGEIDYAEMVLRDVAEE